MIEQTGHGVLLIVDKYGKDVFEFLDNFIKVKIPFAYNIGYERQNVQENVHVKLNKTQLEIYNLIKEYPNITFDELKKLLNVTIRTITRNIAFLKENELIERVGSDKTGY